MLVIHWERHHFSPSCPARVLADSPKQEKKVETDAAENEKDSSTEKESTTTGGAGDASAASASSPTTEKAESDSDATNKTQENGSADETLNDSKSAEDSNKKPKKVKKKWSFRSISFSKKDKQKPVKKDKEGEEKVNGECEKVPEEVSTTFVLLYFFVHVGHPSDYTTPVLDKIRVVKRFFGSLFYVGCVFCLQHR